MPLIAEPAVSESVIARFEACRLTDSEALRAAAVGVPIATLVELVRIDLEFGWDAGQPRALAEYLAAYPILAADPEALAAIAFEEYRQQLAQGLADPADYHELGVDTRDWPAPEPPADQVARSLSALDPAAAARFTAGVTNLPNVGDDYRGFHLERELGRGAFARVFLARQLGLAGRPVALKITATPLQESQTLAQLQHTNIVPIYSTHTGDGLHAVCMPYFGETTLADVVAVVRTQGPPRAGGDLVSTLQACHSTRQTDEARPPRTRTLPSSATLERLTQFTGPDAIVWLIARLADGLAHAHARGILHRDIKPANVLLTDDGQPLILDFNLAATATLTAGIGGTPTYMAPEHRAAFRGDRQAVVDARSDIYSLGLVAFELLTGRLPRLGEPVPNVRTFNPLVSPSVAAVVQMCLAPAPTDRYQSAADLHTDLDRHLAHLPVRHAANPSLRERLQKWTKRHPRAVSGWAVGTVAGLLVVGLAGFGFVTHARTQKLQAYEQMRAFLAEADTLTGRLGAGVLDPHQLPEALAAGEATLSRYGIATDAAWSTRPSVQRLAPQEQARVRSTARTVLQLTARVAEKAGQPSRAEQLLARITDDTPAPDSDDRFRLALDLAWQGEFRAALALAGAEANAAPAHFPTRFLHGVCLLRTGQPTAAATEFEVCLALDANHRPARLNRGLARLHAGEPHAAITDFTTLLERDPADLEALLNRGLAHRDTQNWPAAIADFTRALATGQAPTHVYFSRARAYAAAGNAAAAAADTASGLAEPPRDPLSFAARAAARRANDAAGAAADLQEAVRLAPHDPRYGVGLAGVLADDLHDLIAGTRVLDAVLARDPDCVLALSGRAVLRARAGDRSGAHSDAQAARTHQSPPAALTLYQIAGAYALTAATEPADRSTAFRLLAQALAADPELVRHIATDPELAAWQTNPELQALVAAAQTFLATRR